MVRPSAGSKRWQICGRNAAAGDRGRAERWMGGPIQDFRGGSIVAGMDFKGPIKFNAGCRPAKL
jgi:hypothetical protein